MDGYQDDWGEAIRRIKSARPDVLLVAMGVPLQEKWIAVHRQDLPEVGCFIAVGGLFDNLSGRIPRAPLFVRKARCEWVWRLAMEPRRMFRRYVFGNAAFLWRVWRERRRRRRACG